MGLIFSEVPAVCAGHIYEECGESGAGSRGYGEGEIPGDQSVHHQQRQR